MLVDSLNLPDQCEIVMDDEFARLYPPLSQVERRALEASLLGHGCLDPMVLWAQQNILLDGYNALPACRALTIPFVVKELTFADRDAARAWIIQHQLDERRNLGPEWASYLRGIRYLAEKLSHGGSHPKSSVQLGHLNGSSGQNGPLKATVQNGHSNGASGVQNEHSKASVQNGHLKTKTRLAAEYGVSATTIHRDARFALAVHQLTENCGESARELILGRTAPLRRADVDKLVRLDPADQAEVLNQVRDFGRQALPWAEHRDSDRITVPIHPVALAETVIERLGKTNAARVRDELVAQLSSSVSEEFEPTGNHLS